MGRCPDDLDALALNWIIAGTDAHAKNYSVLLAAGQARLAPLYDVASALAYDDMYPPRLRSAMRIGGEYRIEAIVRRHWQRFCAANRLNENETLGRMPTLAERLPDCFTQAAKAKPVRALRSRLPGRLVDRIAERVKQCRQAFA